MRIGVSTKSVVRQVCGASALRSFMSQGTEKFPPILTEDRRGALEMLVCDAVAFVVMELFPRVSGYRRDGDVHQLEVSVNEGQAKELNVGEAVESSVVSYVINLVYVDVDSEFAERHRCVAERVLSRLRDCFDDLSAGGSPETI